MLILLDRIIERTFALLLLQCLTHSGQRFFQPFLLLTQLCLPFFPFLQQLFHKSEDAGFIPIAILLQKTIQQRLLQRITLQLGKQGHLLFSAPAQLFFVLVLQRFQPFLQHCITLCMKQLPKDLFAVLCRCEQHPLKVSLCQHGDLPVLIAVQSDQTRDRTGHFLITAGHPLTFPIQMCIGLLHRRLIASQGSTLIGRIAMDLIRDLLERKPQLYIRRIAQRSIQ